MGLTIIKDLVLPCNSPPGGGRTTVDMQEEMQEVEGMVRA